MHFILAIPPISANGDPTYYFWVLLKWLHEKKGESNSVILPSQYLDAFDDCFRPEYSEASCNFNEYIPVRKIQENTELFFYTNDSINFDERRPSTIHFVDLITCEQPSLIQFYADTIQFIQKGMKEEVAVITWLNNASLRAAAKLTKCKLIFNEFGPLRKPFYRQTAYWDRHGANGETEVSERWHSEQEEFSAWLIRYFPKDALTVVRSLFSKPESQTTIDRGRERSAVGIALQVETDSNALAYSCGWSNLALLQYAERHLKSESILIRLHPGGAAIYAGCIDLTPSPLAFLSSVSEIWTVNSSLGIEALFWGKKAKFFGDSPINIISSIPEHDRRNFLIWFLLCYLTPFEFIFKSEYYIWRLKGQSVVDIAQRHLEYYQHPATAQWGIVPFPPEPDENNLAIDFPGPRIAPIKLSNQNLEISELKQYVDKLEHDNSILNTLLVEKEQSIQNLSTQLKMLKGTT